jgi:hypothetical protein
MSTVSSPLPVEVLDGSESLVLGLDGAGRVAAIRTTTG